MAQARAWQGLALNHQGRAQDQKNHERAKENELQRWDIVEQALYQGIAGRNGGHREHYGARRAQVMGRESFHEDCVL